MITFRTVTRSFYCPEVSTPVSVGRCYRSVADLLSLLEGPQGSGHPDPDFRELRSQHSRQPCNRSTSRRNTPCHGFQERSR
jgi:hypothetical protein